MRIVRFTPPAGSVLGTDPHFGVLEDETTIRAIASDPLYAGVHKLERTVALKDVRLLAPVIPRSKVVCIGKIMLTMQLKWEAMCRKSQLFS